MIHTWSDIWHQIDGQKRICVEPEYNKECANKLSEGPAAYLRRPTGSLQMQRKWRTGVPTLQRLALFFIELASVQTSVLLSHYCRQIVKLTIDGESPSRHGVQYNKYSETCAEKSNTEAHVHHCLFAVMLTLNNMIR